MADFSQFIIPQQDFSGLYKIGQQLEGKQEAKAKAAQDAANKKATTSALLAKDLELSNFTTGTVEDQIFSRDLGKIQQKADLMANGGYDYNHIRMGIAEDVAKLRTATENVKYAETQRKLGLENIKGKKGYNPDAYNAEFIKKYYLGADGKPREDYWNLNTAEDFDAEIKKSGNIYNLDEAVGEDIKNMGKSSEMTDVKVRDAKGNVKTVKKKIQTSSSFVPDIDAQGVFQGVVPQHTIAPTTDATKSISEYISGDANKPLRMVSDNEFNRMRYNPAVMGGVNAETQKFAQALGRVPQPEEIIAFQKAKLYDIYSNNAKVGFAHEDVQETKAPVTRVSVNVGGTGDKTLQFRDIYKQVIDRFEQEAEGVERGGQAAFVPINKMEADAGTIITDIANKRKPGRATKYNADDLYIVRTGDMKGYEIRDVEGTLVMPFNKAEDINPKGNYGTKVKQKAATTPGNAKSTSKGASNKKVTDPDILRQLNQQ
jgi:hypothetical protein